MVLECVFGLSDSEVTTAVGKEVNVSVGLALKVICRVRSAHELILIVVKFFTPLFFTALTSLTPQGLGKVVR